MRPIRFDEIVGPDRYAELRPAYREAVIAYKRKRRLGVGEKVSLTFEDHETLRFQIQEMVWVERIGDPAKVQAEIDVYNELMPGENELSATLFVEITDAPSIRPELDRLIGIDEHVCLVLGAGADAETVAASFDPKQLEEDRISAVQYIRFPLGARRARRFADPSVPASVRIDHPHYAREADIPDEVRRSLCETLAGEPTALLPAGPGPQPERAGEVVFETPRLRALRPGGPAARAQLVVEAREPGVSLLRAEPELAAELIEALQRAAALLLREHGVCHIRTEVDPERPQLRWHLFGAGR